jgi:putative tRNA adenosine deaminase-associated protein
VAETYDAWALVVFRQDGAWQVAQLPPRMAEDLDAVVAAVRGQAPGAFALVDVADEFFVAVRLVGGEERYLLSDAGASLDWDLAAQVMDRLDLDVPNDDESQDLWPVGELGAILGDEEAYADEMLSSLAQRLGFADAFEQVVDALV